MILKLDTEAKTILIEGDVNLNDLYTTLNVMLPNEIWKEFKLIQKVPDYIYQPITIQPYNSPVVAPWVINPYTNPTPYRPWVTYCGSTDFNVVGNQNNGNFSATPINNYTLNKGIYEVVVVNETNK